MRYFVDLSEVYDAGGSVEDIQLTTNYMQDSSANGIYPWDEEKHIYYISIGYTDGALFPGGQENYRKEVQFRMRNTKGVWDNSNDFSFEGLSNGSLTVSEKIAIYEGGELVFGSEP